MCGIHDEYEHVMLMKNVIVLSEDEAKMLDESPTAILTEDGKVINLDKTIVDEEEMAQIDKYLGYVDGVGPVYPGYSIKRKI